MDATGGSASRAALLSHDSYTAASRKHFPAASFLPPHFELEAATAEWSKATGASPGPATLLALLRRQRELSPEMSAVVDAVGVGTLHVPARAGDWLAEIAHRLFGPRGPEVVVG